MEIQVNYPKEVIDELVGIGSYKIESTASNKIFTLTSPPLLQIVTIGGDTLTENIKINIKIPELYTNKGASIAKAESMKTIKDPIDIVISFVYPAPKPSKNIGIRQGNNLGAIQGDTKGKRSSSEDVQKKFDDIIMGGMPLDDFND